MLNSVFVFFGDKDHCPRLCSQPRRQPGHGFERTDSPELSPNIQLMIPYTIGPFAAAISSPGATAKGPQTSSPIFRLRTRTTPTLRKERAKRI